MLCKNVVALKSKLAELDGTHVLKANVIFEHELELATCAEIRGALARLSEKRRTCSNTDLAMWETAIGFSYHEHGLLQDASLVPYVSPSKVYCHDWMHGMMAGGGCAMLEIDLRLQIALRMIQNTIDAESGNCALNRGQCNVISGVFNVVLFLVLMDIAKATPRNVEFDVLSHFGGYLKLWI